MPCGHYGMSTTLNRLVTSQFLRSTSDQLAVITFTKLAYGDFQPKREEEEEESVPTTMGMTPLPPRHGG